MSDFVITNKYEDINDVGSALNKIRIFKNRSRKEYKFINIQEVYSEIINLFELRDLDLENVKEQIKRKLGKNLVNERDFLISMVDLYGFQNELNELKKEYNKLKEILKKRLEEEEELFIKSSFNHSLKRSDKTLKELKENMEIKNLKLETIMEKMEVLEKFERINNLDDIKRLLKEFKTLTEPTIERRRSFFRRSRRIDIIGGKKSKKYKL